MADEARRYWESLAAGDVKTADALARRVIDRLNTQADEAESKGEYTQHAIFHREASMIGRGELAPYPKVTSFPLTSAEIGLLEPGQQVTDLRGDEWVVAGHPWYDPLLIDRPQAWSVGVKRLRDGAFRRIDSRDQWTLAINGHKNDRIK
ncbi:MAG TPA: hypothetical protein VF221_12720 [Chloroflexota bacterium]